MSGKITVRHEMLMYKKEKDLGGGWGRLVKYRLDPEHPAAGSKKGRKWYQEVTNFTFFRLCAQGAD